MLHKIKILATVVILFTILLAFAACKNYYKISKNNISNPPGYSLDSLEKKDRYFVLRAGNNSYYMNNIVLSADQKTLTASLDTLLLSHMVHLGNGRGKMRYKNSESSVLNEVHLYVKDIPGQFGNYTLSLNDITKIEVLEKNKGRTTASYILGTLGYTLGTMALASAIIVATKSSCPFVSAYNGNDFVLQGEIYGGAIYPQLVRHDYLPLNMATAANGNLQLKISNELQEQQFTDMADLIVIKHSKQASVINDSEGNLYSINKPEAPVTAILSGKKDVRESILLADQRLLYFDDSSSNTGNNYVVLQFNKQENIGKGKLILTLKNSYWLDYLYGEVAKGFGSFYNIYTKQQHKKPAAQLNKWTSEQQVPLEVSIKTNEGWKKITELTTIGPVAVRDIVVPVDLSIVKDSKIEIKLSSGYLFWELDYAAMDFGADDKMEVQILKPYTAHDETGKDVLNVLSKEDGKYLAQPLPGTVATLEYKWHPENNNDEAYTFILHTKGYYEHVRSFKGAPNTKFLKQFKRRGAFPQFSLQRFKQFNKEQTEMLTKNN